MSHVEPHPGCRSCGAGSLLSFNWEYARTTSRPEHQRDLSVFVKPVPLRYGTLYKCRSCGQPWYLAGEPAFMNFVPRNRRDLINQWNEREIVIASSHAAQLAAIGRTPPDIYGNRSQYCEIPCTVTTAQGQKIEKAVVSLQRHAPFEEWRDCRLATEIAEISPSPYALPLPVRVATSKADEIRMGFAPTMVTLSNGELLALNWSQHFLVRDGIDASKVTLTATRVDMMNLPAVYNGPKDVVYFIADRALGIP